MELDLIFLGACSLLATAYAPNIYPPLQDSEIRAALVTAQKVWEKACDENI